MSNYQLLRMIRIVLWVAFILSLPLATSFTASDPMAANVVRYAPPVLLLLALLVGIIERMLRKRHNFRSSGYGAPDWQHFGRMSVQRADAVIE